MDHGLETKLCRLDQGVQVAADGTIEGYASVFEAQDQGGDVVRKGAYDASLKRLGVQKRGVKMLWQHDPTQPIGIWDEVREDSKGLYVKGRILNAVEKGREATELLKAGAIDGLSIGYRTIRAARNKAGQRVLQELDLWEVSLVTFPMLPQARVAAKQQAQQVAALDELARLLDAARRELAGE